MSMNTVALEMVPPNVDGGLDRAAEELRKLRQFSAEFGIDRRIAHVMIPSMIVEDGDRPLEMKPKLDVVDYWSIIRAELPAVRDCARKSRRSRTRRHCGAVDGFDRCRNGRRDLRWRATHHERRRWRGHTADRRAVEVR